MKSASFDYHAPSSVEEAIELLVAYDDEAKALAGGQSLVPLMNLRLSAPRAIVDLRRVDELGGIEVSNGNLAMGAMTTYATALADSRVQDELAVLACALRWVGHPAIRTAGTLGGSVAHADPAAEVPMILTLLEGEVVARGPRGERRIPAADFFLTYFTTALESDEVLTQLRWPCRQGPPAHRLGWGFREVARRHGDFCLVGASSLLALDPDGRVSRARVVLAGIADRPYRLSELEALLVGELAHDSRLRDVADAAAGSIEPPGDLHASADYRRHVARVLTYRVLSDSVQRAEGGDGS